MCPYRYYTLMRNARDRKHLRLQMVRHVEAHGVKATARAFHTTAKTVRKWRDRFDDRLASLADRSRAPHRRPRRFRSGLERP